MHADISRGRIKNTRRHHHELINLARHDSIPYAGTLTSERARRLVLGGPTLLVLRRLRRDRGARGANCWPWSQQGTERGRRDDSDSPLLAGGYSFSHRKGELRDTVCWCQPYGLWPKCTPEHGGGSFRSRYLR